MALREVTDSVVILKQIIEGKRGLPGKDGVTTTVTETITKEGKVGKDGSTPEHEVNNGEVRFKNPDGTWGKWIEVQPQSSGGGAVQVVKYTAVEAANFKVIRQGLIEGTNIFGVNYPGEVELILPSGIDKNIIIVVKDESNNASTNNITITTENQ